MATGQSPPGYFFRSGRGTRLWLGGTAHPGPLGYGPALPVPQYVCSALVSNTSVFVSELTTKCLCDVSFSCTWSEMHGNCGDSVKGRRLSGPVMAVVKTKQDSEMSIQIVLHFLRDISLFIVSV